MMAARENDRSVCLVGRSMHRMVGAAKAIGLLGDVGHLLDEEEAVSMPQGHVLYLCTGSQGESRAALSRIANNEHRSLRLSKGDVVIFSSKIIPGNEKGIFALQNALADEGIEIVTEKDRDIHVSGHPCRAELAKMYEWARLLAPTGPKIVDITPAGRLHQDGNLIVSATDEGLRKRLKMAYAGQIAISLVFDSKGQLISGPEPRIDGFPEGEHGDHIEAMLDDVADEAEAAFFSIGRNGRKEEDVVEDRIRSKVRKLVRNRTGKRPVVNVIAHKVK